VVGGSSGCTEAVIPSVYPQSFKSGRLSSSSAQSIWLPGVCGRSIATDLTRTTRASMSLLSSVVAVVGVADEEVDLSPDWEMAAR
jgi:hypothetical protein